MKRGFVMLVADDDANDLALLKLAVELGARKAGIRITVQAVEDGETAIAYLSGGGKFARRDIFPFPDIIVLDLKMPGLDGLDILEWLGNNDEYRRIPKIMLSGSGQERDVEEAYRLGVNTYFQKSANFDEFKELIHDMIRYWSHTERPIIKHRLAHG